MHIFDEIIAKEYGVVEAIIIQEVDHWLSVNKANGVNFIEGKYWTYFTAEKFCNNHLYISQGIFRNTIKKLSEANIVQDGCFNTDKSDRTKWYTFTDDFIAKYNHRLSYTSSTEEGENQNSPYLNSNVEVKKKVKKFKEQKVYDKDSVEYKMANEFFQLIRKLNPGFKEPNLQNWAKEMDLLHNRDGKPKEQIWEIMQYVHHHNFWKTVVLSARKLREKFDSLVIKRQADIDSKK